MKQVFDAYAAYYDLLYRDKDYAAEAEYVVGLIKKHAPEAKTILELGCGTGAHAEHFSGMGYTVQGIDMSVSMLARAEERRTGLSEELAQRMSFAEGDVRTWRAGKIFDVVVSLFHVFSYQTTNDDLRAAFETASNHLKPGGVLIFDFWNGPAVLSQRPEVRVRRLEDERIQVMRIAEPVLLPVKNTVIVNYDVQIIDKVTAERTLITESHEMRYLFQPEIESYASSAFTVKAHFAWMQDTQATIDDWASVALLEKT